MHSYTPGCHAETGRKCKKLKTEERKKERKKDKANITE
jgi:hypothetical protein